MADQLVEQARADGVALTGEGGLLTGLVQRVLQGALEAEITDHLGYEPHAFEGRGSGNSRNGHYPKTVRTEVGDVRVDVPRDRNGSFEPGTVPVGQRRLSGLDQMVISLYAKGLTTGDIAAHLEDVYDQRVDRATISRTTEVVTADLEAWQSRPLDSIYPVLFVDGIRIKIRDGTVANRVVYVVMGITLDGDRDILGLWVGPSGGESPKFWLSVMTELRNRGIADVLLLCCDGLRGLPDAARSAWPLVDVQLCVVHLVRIDRPWWAGTRSQPLAGLRLMRRRWRLMVVATQSCRAVSSVQPRAVASRAGRGCRRVALRGRRLGRGRARSCRIARRRWRSHTRLRAGHGSRSRGRGGS